MSLITVRNKLDQEVQSTKKVGASEVNVTFEPLQSIVLNDNEVSATMQQQITNGILQITSEVPSADAGEGFVSAMDLASSNARLALSLTAGQFFVLDKVVARVTEGTAITVDAAISVGSVAPNYEDLVTEKELAQCRTEDDAWVEAVEGKAKVVNGPAEVWVNCKTPATGTSLVADIFLFGTGNFS